MTEFYFIFLKKKDTIENIALRFFNNYVKYKQVTNVELNAHNPGCCRRVQKTLQIDREQRSKKVNTGPTLLTFQCNSGLEEDNIIQFILNTNFGMLQSYRIII